MIYYILLFQVSAQVDFSYIPPYKTPPSPRGGYVLCSYPSTNSLILFGGTYSQYLYNDLWAFSTITLSWSEMYPTSTEMPSQRSYLGGFISAKTEEFYIFGGSSIMGPQNDFWKFDIENFRWTSIQTKRTPTIRFGYACTSFVRNDIEYFAIFGGQLKEKMDNTLILYGIFRLNMQSLEWEYKDNVGDVPQKSSYGTIVYNEGCVYYTGFNMYEYDESFEILRVFRYCLDKGIWEDITSEEETKIPRRYASGFVYEEYFYLFFGYDDYNYADYDTIIRLDLKLENALWEDFLQITEISKDSFFLAALSENIYIFGGYSCNTLDMDNRLSLINIKAKNYTELNSNYISPEGRYLGSMSVINTKFYLFGGKNSQKLFNDMWIYHTDQSYWESVTISGDTPSARYLHSASSEGDAIILWGGSDSEELKNDLFIFNALTNIWSKIIPLSTAMPSAAKGACLISKIPKIYIYGGITNSGFSGELWEFDMGTLEYKLISKNIQIAYHTCEIQKNVIYIIFGTKSSDDPVGLVNAYNLTSNKWTIPITGPENILYSESLQILLGDSVVSIGGRYWKLMASQQAIIIKNETYDLTLTISGQVYSSNYVYYKTSVYAFGGGSIFGVSLRSSISTSLFFSIDLKNICHDDICTALCSSGTYKKENSCIECSPGYYAEGKGNVNCSACPAGTYNQNYGSSSSRQCYPCPEKTFSNAPGAALCYECPSSHYCPTGSENPTITELSSPALSIQPSLFNAPGYYSIIISYQFTIGVIFLIGLLLILCVNKLKMSFLKVDFYNEKHNHKHLQAMIIKNTPLGSFYTLAFLCLATIFVGSTLIQYDIDNIQENKGLVPLLVLEDKITTFSTPSFYLYISFFSYGDICGKNYTCSSGISLQYLNIYGSSISAKCELSDTKECLITIKCSDCTIKAGAQVLISASESLSYTSGIKVNITSDSSIPEAISSLTYFLYPSTNYVFIGSKASEFFFTITPSVFTSESNKWPYYLTGYHVSSEVAPTSGSQLLNTDMPIASQVKIKIFLDLTSSGLLTQRTLKQSWLFLMSGMLGSVFGIHGFVGLAMNLSEQFSEKIKNKRDAKKNFENIHMRRKILSRSSFKRMNEKSERANNSTYELPFFTVTNLEDTQIIKNNTDCIEFEWAVISGSTN